MSLGALQKMKRAIAFEACRFYCNRKWISFLSPAPILAYFAAVAGLCF